MIRPLIVTRCCGVTNPQVAKDMQQLQQPLVNLSTRCKLPISLPQLMGLMQAAQQQGGAGLPGALQTAQSVGASGAALPASSSPASAVTQGSGPLPGPRQPPAASTARRAQRRR